MRIKIFENGHVEELEQEINEWLSQHSDIEVLDTNQTETAFLEGGDILANITVSIFYKHRKAADR